MRLGHLVTGTILLLASCHAQRRPCEIDTDLIFFEDADLERLKNSFRSGGECSPTGLKDELENSLHAQGKEVRDLSRRDREVMEYLNQLEQKRDLSPDFYLYLGSQKKTMPTKESDFESTISTADWRTSFADFPEPTVSSYPQIRRSELFKPAVGAMVPRRVFPNNNRPREEPLNPDQRLIRPSWHHILEDLHSLSQPNNGRSLNQQGGNPNSITPSIFNSRNRFSINQRRKDQNHLFRPLQNQFRPEFQNDESNEVVMPDRMTSTTTPRGATEAPPPSPCVRRCPNTPEYNPVCGSDRVTYRNPGRLRCEQQCGKGGVRINYYGTCVVAPADPLIPPGP